MDIGIIEAPTVKELFIQKITGMIIRGELKPGEKLPSLRKLAELWNTNSFSVNLAMDELTELGFLTKQHGRGVFVTPAKEKIQNHLQ